MADPLSDFEKIRDFYITYLETAFRIGSPEIQERRRELLERFDTLCTEPLFEPVPRYETQGLRLDQLVEDGPAGRQYLPGFTHEERERFVRLALAGLLPSENGAATDKMPRGRFHLYSHQLEMLERGVDGKPGIVTSGTGSGKTEAFLLPILASISKEAAEWPDSPDLNPAPAWWRDTESDESLSEKEFRKRVGTNPSEQFIHRRAEEHSARPRAIRALILYPMNALVEDQLVRIRKALDSDPAHQVLDDRFGGNRIFFGRYTSATPVTGYLQHPRLKEEYREKSVNKLMELFQEVTSAERTWEKARETAHRRGDHDLPFNFPRIGGSELFSRWDMHRAPPDILVTNTTMLSALLMREVEEPLWEKTRDWLHSNEDAYFYLVLDELHLQRGTAGTEVSFLLQLLIHRLGLHHPAHRHKLQILASSASLPMSGEERSASLDYLWDMFGRSGLEDADSSREEWSDAVITGEEIIPETSVELPIEASRVTDAVEECSRGGQLHASEDNTTAWTKLGSLVGIDTETGDRGSLVRRTIKNAADLLTSVCRDSDSETTTRPTTVSNLTERLFNSREPEAVEAFRALLRVRGAASELQSWFPDQTEQNESFQATSFRVHLFLRAVEGLFAAPKPLSTSSTRPQRVQRLFSELSVERGERFREWQDGSRSRVLELLYCECCGELFFGGMRGTSASQDVELLPSDPDPERLPDRSKPQLFERLSANDFAVFWPTVHDHWPWGSAQPLDSEAQAPWRRATLDVESGRIRLAGTTDDWEGGSVPGFLYAVDGWTSTTTHPDESGSAVPYQCPFCGESYRYRRTRTSPIRNFRAGFAKTTQLLASELVARFRDDRAKDPDDVKLVSFADSRQDAAKAALDLESRHHEDVRREFLVKALRKVASERSEADEIKHRIETVESEMREAMKDDRLERVGELGRLRDRLKTELQDASEKSIPLRELLDVGEGRTVSQPLKPVTAELVAAGIHPIDPTGIASIEARGRRFAWQQLFQRSDTGWKWNDHPAYKDSLKAAQNEVRDALRLLATETIFHRSYFSLEEAGLAYASVRSNGLDPDTFRQYNAVVRILGDMWRYRPRPEEWTPPKVWQRPSDTRGQFKRYAETLWGDRWEERVEDFLTFMESQGHKGAILQAEDLRLMPIQESDPFWRCGNCGRVHLHRGGEICTRCREPLSSEPTGSVSQLRKNNYLAKRVEDTSPAYRLRAEELTAMTSNPGARLRRFKGIMIKDRDDILPEGEDMDVDPDLDHAARIIDVLSVTTTMEVGVDIGALEGVFQANMPPQRFNYQQRVGRAGRRGRPFSTVLTICRSKSHDLHYFRHPEAITGDAPPPPFLTSELEVIGRRLVRKAWLWMAFRNLRAGWDPTDWPADQMKPDIHGEFMTVEEYHDRAGSFEPRFNDVLTKTQEYRDDVAEWFADGSNLEAADLLVGLDVESIIEDIRGLDPGEYGGQGIGQALAERGQLPMYGMPTRVRSLYTGPPPPDDQNTWEPDAIDRDLEIAIQEFAPGEYVIKDKRRHLSVGFTGSLLPGYPRYGSVGIIDPLGDAFGDEFSLVQCNRCRGWSRVLEGSDSSTLTCDGCTAVLPTDEIRKCVVPNGFRTTLIPHKEPGEFEITPRQKSAMAETEPLNLNSIPGTNISKMFLEKASILRINQGRIKDDKWTGFEAFHGSTQHANWRLDNQWIDSRFTNDSELDYTDYHEEPKEFFLAAPKVTNSLILAPNEIPKGLRLDLEPDKYVNPLGRRAALISATFFLVYRAARELDVDPEEFEIVEPRTYRPDGQAPKAVIQFSDALINGSGLCDWLLKTGTSGQPKIAEIAASIVRDPKDYPLNDLFAGDHPTSCDQSCYRCLNRFGNQPYHGLLDWRLGLDVLNLLTDSSFRVGLNGDFKSPGLEGWPDLAERYAHELAKVAGTNEHELAGFVPCARIEVEADTWAAVVHPLWDWNLMLETTPELLEFHLNHETVIPATTFDAARRPVGTIERLRRRAG